MSIRLQPSVFDRTPSTDFFKLIDQAAYADALFVFNDNVAQFKAFQSGDRNSGCSPGAGNGGLRPYQCQTPPRVAGIPTGPGYDALTDDVIALTDEAAAYIAKVVQQCGYTRVIYSASAEDPGMIGISTFHVADDVRRYCITALARELGVAAPGSPAIANQAAAVAPTLPKPNPQAVSINGVSFNLVAFYFPDYETPWDKVYRAPFLGNFWTSPLTLRIGRISGSFLNAEAAFQATKWWSDEQVRKEFERCETGTKAFQYKGTLTGEDGSYAGLQRDGAMREVLKAKYSGADLKTALLNTGDAYLLEHDVRSGPNHMYWSDNSDGTGKNMLGKLLMELRGQLGGAAEPSHAPAVREFTRVVKSGS